MIIELLLDHEDTVHQIWRLQQVAYRLEAEIIGFSEIPPLLDTYETLSQCGETFFGEVDEYGELQGAIAIISEATGTMTITRMMVKPANLRKGIAGKLIQYVLDDHKDTPLFIVSTGTCNTPAFALYLKYGFIPFDTYEVVPKIELTTFHRQQHNHV
ncbi:GNAT family N-acetyltransferase [Paenibacillus macquariensis]|uniref:Acetyltransferase (GNAT) domain-containing protein n=1 Tax=Paenibacillus macquariensis TaxID=948756 RepID=A0ABY1K8F1_9BACL|nr:GNAT family N-acetyltransferase [Paenibacillus macquariensis]MEC0093231.1 GNAT family N-acetyltransferase [Paenibacillus macquariensis]OAB27601.1 histone acetyltransferase [Paenibacillus macquariensis subsp. macquariensis]SIR40345.1 Acetyltransferase (GNAT) domain-containing protein [Paenibacillus macquariensis]